MPFYPFEMSVLFNEMKAFHILVGLLSLLLSAPVVFLAWRWLQWSCVVSILKNKRMQLLTVAEEERLLVGVFSFTACVILIFIYLYFALTLLFQILIPHLTIVSDFPHSLKVDISTILSHTMLRENKILLAVKGSGYVILGFVLLLIMFICNYYNLRLWSSDDEENDRSIPFIVLLVGNPFFTIIGGSTLWSGLYYIIGAWIAPHYMFLLQLS